MYFKEQKDIAYDYKSESEGDGIIGHQIFSWKGWIFHGNILLRKLSNVDEDVITLKHIWKIM